MKKYIFTILLAMMLVGCNVTVSTNDIEHTMYSNGYEITAKMFSIVDGYVYWYRLQDQVTDGMIGWYTDKSYDVGDVIWMGARWGRKYNKDVEVDSN